MVMQQSIKAAIESGIEPIALRYRTIHSCMSGTPCAVYAETVLNSTVIGELKPEKYDVVAARTIRGEKLSLWAITYAARAVAEA